MVAKPPSFAPARAGAPAFGGDRPSAARRGYDRKWRAIRAAFLRAHPRCACGSPASEADHVTPLAAGGTHGWLNLRALCKPCHSRKTAARDGGFGNQKISDSRGRGPRRGQTLDSTKLVF
ncbi:MAG: HNH endonuclease signature motif containing protein [Parvularculaceae bacterium]